MSLRIAAAAALLTFASSAVSAQEGPRVAAAPGVPAVDLEVGRLASAGTDEQAARQADLEQQIASVESARAGAIAFTVLGALAGAGAIAGVSLVLMEDAGTDNYHLGVYAICFGALGVFGALVPAAIALDELNDKLERLTSALALLDGQVELVGVMPQLDVEGRPSGLALGFSF